MSVRRARASGWLGLLVGGCLAACGSGGPSAGSAERTWLSENCDERLLQLERHLRGLDVAMVEIGHRYVGLYWAGRDANWKAAAYELQKMRLALENGLERRPKRADSARTFLAGPLPALEEAVAARDPALFAARFRDLSAGCNACHAREDVPFFEIRPPSTRVSPVHYEASEPAAE